MLVGRYDSGRDAVIAWPDEERSTSGATTHTLPNSAATSARHASPGLYTPSSFDTRMRMSPDEAKCPPERTDEARFLQSSGCHADEPDDRGGLLQRRCRRQPGSNRDTRDD